MMISLADHVRDYEQLGCERRDKSLGIKSMPDGYALMLDTDRMYYFWVDGKGKTSVEHWDKWAVWRSAVFCGRQERP